MTSLCARRRDCVRSLLALTTGSSDFVDLLVCRRRGFSEGTGELAPEREPGVEAAFEYEARRSSRSRRCAEVRERLAASWALWKVVRQLEMYKSIRKVLVRR